MFEQLLYALLDSFVFHTFVVTPLPFRSLTVACALCIVGHSPSSSPVLA